LEESKDTNSPKINFDDDDDDEVCQEEKIEEKQATKAPVNVNRFALFEEFCSFLTTKDDADPHAMLNPVLLGYWCNLFRSLV